MFVTNKPNLMFTCCILLHFRVSDHSESRTAMTSLRAAAVSKEHRREPDVPGSRHTPSGRASVSRTSSTSSAHRNSSPHRDDVISGLKPALTSTPIDGSGGGGAGGASNGGSRRRSRNHSGNSVTFQQPGAVLNRQGHADAGGGGGGAVMGNPDEIIVLEGDEDPTPSLTSSGGSSAHAPSAVVPPGGASGGAAHHVTFAQEMEVQAPIVGYEIMEERARFTVSTSCLRAFSRQVMATLVGSVCDWDLADR